MNICGGAASGVIKSARILSSLHVRSPGAVALESHCATLLAARPLSGLRWTGESLAADSELAKRSYFDERKAAGVVCKAVARHGSWSCVAPFVITHFVCLPSFCVNKNTC